jgi:type VI secretion system secreted protein VgrG
MPATSGQSYDSEQTPESNGQLAVHSRCVVSTIVLIANAAVNWPLKSFRLEQSTFNHHRLVLNFSLDIESMAAGQEFVSTTQFQDTIGKNVSLKITPTDEYVDSGEALEFIGLITNVGLANSGGAMNVVTIEAMSPTILLDQAAAYRFYEKQTFADVVRSIMGAYSVDTGAITIGGAFTRDFWAQWSETDWEYITTRWRTYPGWVFYDGKKLIIEEKKSRNTHKLSWQKHVGAADVRMNMTGYKFRNPSWDEAQKQPLNQEVTVQTQFSGVAQKTYASSASKMNQTSSVALPLRGDTKTSEVQQITGALQAEKIGTMVLCRLQTNVPSLKVGDTLTLEKMGDTYTGTYIITAIEHRIENGSDYHNFVTASPLETAYPTAPVARNERQSDPMMAIVTDNNDPDMRGRVKVKFPMKSASGGDLESPWLRTTSGYAGSNRGMYFMPEINDEVLVGFEMGDSNMPVVLGSLWNGVDKPPQSAINPGGDDGELSKNDNKVIYSRAGHQIILSDKDGAGKIKIVDRTGKNTMIIDSKENTISITADKDYNLTVKGNVTMKADGDFKLEAQNVSIDAKMSCKIKAGGGGAEITSSAMMKLDASAKMDIGGAMIDINGKGPVNVKGTPISLN